MRKSSMKSRVTNNTSDRVAATGTDSNIIFKWSDDLIEDLLKALSSFKTVMEFQNKDFNGDKPCQYEKVRKENCENLSSLDQT